VAIRRRIGRGFNPVIEAVSVALACLRLGSGLVLAPVKDSDCADKSRAGSLLRAALRRRSHMNLIARDPILVYLGKGAVRLAPAIGVSDHREAL